MFPPSRPIPITTRQGWEDEYVTARYWNRPVRKYYTDSPYYPWMPKPPPQFRVSFKLGFQ